MGWSHSVYVGQAIHEKLLVDAGLETELRISKGNRVLTEFQWEAYVEDYFTCGYSVKAARYNLWRVVDKCERINLPSKPEKREVQERK